MKNLLLILLGCTPFLVGNTMSYLMNTVYYDSGMPYRSIAICLLVCWFVIGKLIYKFTKTSRYTALIVHIPAFAVLVFILFQEWVLHEYWASIIGVRIQCFYLPLISLPRIIPFSEYIFNYGLATSCIFSFLFMYGVFYLGCKPKKLKDAIASDWTAS